MLNKIYTNKSQLKPLKKEVNDTKIIYFFLILYISIKNSSFGNNVNNIFLKEVFL